jgi:predicted phage terminase large subunit-like protein
VPAPKKNAPSKPKDAPEQNPIADLEAQVQAAKRLRAVKLARKHLLAFRKITMPDPDAPDDPEASRYQETAVARLLCDALEKVERGELLRLCVSVGPQFGKPIYEEELLAMADGSRKRLKDIAVGDRVVSHAGKARRVEQVFVQGDLPCIEIKTKKGRAVKAALDHPFLTTEGWKKAGELEVGDVLAVPRGWNAGGESRSEEARLAGYIVGDGNVTFTSARNGRSVCQKITCFDEEQSEDIRSCALRLGFGISDAASHSQKKCIALLGATDWIHEIGLAGHTSHTKRVPDFVFRSDNETVAHFVGAYFACDGSVSKKNGRNGKPRKATTVQFFSVNRDLLQDVQHLLARLGINSSLNIKSALKGTNFTNGQPYFSWSLNVCSQNDVAKFIATIPVFGKKGHILKEMRARPNAFLADFLCDEVSDLLDAGTLPCRCLTVEEDHTFLVNDLVVHNSDLISRALPAWYMGRNPYKHFMLGTYSQDFANDFGGEVRELITSPSFRQVFPEFAFRKGSQAKDTMITTKGGRMNFLGRGGAGSGKPADFLVIDDPIKDDKEAQSATIRKDLWNWFNKVMLARCHRFTPIVIVHTRWHEDDLIGRLVDPSHPEHDPKVAAEWTYLNIPAIVKDPGLAAALGLKLEVQTDPEVVEQFGAEPIATLWPERKSMKFLAAARRLDKKAFESLYMGNPAPDDGDYFKRADLIGYEPGELPQNLMMYGASDHALTTKEENDANCAGAIGVDERGDLWILPDLFWKRAETDETLDAILTLMKRHKMLLWFAEDEHINKALGPFRRRKQREEGIYTAVQGIPPGRRDLVARARSAQGMTQLRKIHFPKFAHWWPEAENELLKFPSAAHDDFVSFLAIACLGLDSQASATVVKKEGNVYRVGTFGWLKNRTREEERIKKLRARTAGM